MGYYIELRGQIDKDEVVLDNEKFRKIKEKYFWIEFDEYGFEFAGNWSYDIIDFFEELSKIIKKGKVIIDYDDDEPRDIKQYKISKNSLIQREAKRIIFSKWHVYNDSL